MDGHEGETKEANKDGPTAEPDYAEQLNQWAIQVNNMFHMTVGMKVGSRIDSHQIVNFSLWLSLVGFPYFMLNQANFSLQCQCVLLQQQQAQLQTQYAQLLQLEQQNGQTRQRGSVLFLCTLWSNRHNTGLGFIQSLWPFLDVWSEAASWPHPDTLLATF